MARQYPKVLKGEDTGRLNREEVARVIEEVRLARLAREKAAKLAARRSAAGAGRKKVVAKPAQTDQ